VTSSKVNPCELKAEKKASAVLKNRESIPSDSLIAAMSENARSDVRGASTKALQAPLRENGAESVKITPQREWRFSNCLKTRAAPVLLMKML
jgi:nitrogen fixation protein FixH